MQWLDTCLYCKVWNDCPYMSFSLSLSLFFCILGPHAWHMEVPRLGVKLGLRLLVYTATIARHICNLQHSSQQHWILNPLSKARDQTYILMVPSQVHFCCATGGAPVNISPPQMPYQSWLLLFNDLNNRHFCSRARLSVCAHAVWTGVAQPRLEDSWCCLLALGLSLRA